jgi:hypothetical protein
MAQEPQVELDGLECVAELRYGVRADLCQMALEAAGVQAWLSSRNQADAGS